MIFGRQAAGVQGGRQTSLGWQLAVLGRAGLALQAFSLDQARAKAGAGFLTMQLRVHSGPSEPLVRGHPSFLTLEAPRKLDSESVGAAALDRAVGRGGEANGQGSAMPVAAAWHQQLRPGVGCCFCSPDTWARASFPSSVTRGLPAPGWGGYKSVHTHQPLSSHCTSGTCAEPTAVCDALHVCGLLLVLGRARVAGAGSAPFLVRTSGSETRVAGLGHTEWQ